MADRFDLINFGKSVVTTTGGTTANVNIDANTLFIDGTNNRVGIGTNAPGGSLEVSGLGRFKTGAGHLDIRHDGVNGSFVNNTGNLLMYADGAQGIILHTNSLQRMIVTSTGDLQFNSGYGSVATAFGCRAWVNFNGTGTVAIRASGNVSSITDNGVGNYTVNFTNAMPDANYIIAGVGTGVAGSDYQTWITYDVTMSTSSPSLKSTTQCRVVNFSGWASAPGLKDTTDMNVAFFR